MPEWMFGQEVALESLRTKELGGGTGSRENVEDKMDILENEETDETDEREVSSRMIDTPFDLFGEDF
jgi:hypothetical protein